VNQRLPDKLAEIVTNLAKARRSDHGRDSVTVTVNFPPIGQSSDRPLGQPAVLAESKIYSRGVASWSCADCLPSQRQGW